MPPISDLRILSLSKSRGDDNKQGLEPALDQARRTADVAHSVLVKLKEMGLPEDLDEELASLCTDLGDLWSAERALVECLDGFLKSTGDWEAVGESLVDVRASVDHITWHITSVRRPLTRITQFAYRKALEVETPGNSQ